MIKDYIILNKQKSIIFIILFVYTIFLIWYSFTDISVWWDESVYIGMGKYIATGGSLGMWEIFRPPFLPLIFSLFFKLNIPLIIAGKILLIISSVGSLYLVYNISEFIKKNSGIYSSIFLMITPIFFLYSRVPMTDIISIFFTLLTLFFFLRKKYFLTGICISTSFLFRFPQGLILLPILITTIINTYDRNIKKWINKSFIIIFYIMLGFLSFVLPYLISNYLLYGDIFRPFVLANMAVSLSSELYDLGLFYYIGGLFKINPLLFLSFIFPFFIFKNNFFDDDTNRKNFILILITSTIVIIYFFLQTHKELRYSLAFAPYLSIISGISFVFIFNIFKQNKLILILLSIYILSLLYISRPYFRDEGGYDYVPLNNYMETLKGSYISTTPLLAAFGEVHILSLFERYSGFETAYRNNIDSLDGIFIKDCDLFCAEKKETRLCYNDLTSINDIIAKSKFKKTYEVVIDKCTFDVYKK